MNATAQAENWLTVSWNRNSVFINTLWIIGETAKAYNVKNEFGLKCWIPKTGLKPTKPGEPTYENCFYIADWFRASMTAYQERVITPGQ